MFNRVVVPLDGSRLSEEALPFAARLLAPPQGSLILVHAVTPSEYFSVTAAQYVQQERRRSAIYLQKLAERLGNPSLGVQERIVTGEASREIVAEAKRCRADLIVMSSHGRSGIREWAFGSVAERVLRGINMPVLVFRGNLGKAYTIRKILVALDDSEETLESVIPAADVAAAFSSAVILAHVGKRRPPTLPMAEKLLTQHGRSFETLLLRGDPAQALLEAAEREKVDLLGLAMTGKTRRAPVTFGSVAERVLMNCGRPLLVINTGRTD